MVRINQLAQQGSRISCESAAVTDRETIHHISSEILRSLFTSTKQRPIANIWKAFQTSDIKLYHRKLFRGLALLAPLRFLLPVHCHGTVGSDRKTVLRPFRFELHQDNHRCGNGRVRCGSSCFTCRQKQRPR